MLTPAGFANTVQALVYRDLEVDDPDTGDFHDARVVNYERVAGDPASFVYHLTAPGVSDASFKISVSDVTDRRTPE
jgi:hypothetical protein